jgi:hypothetical protein
MTDKIDVSIIATAHRPENWMRVYESIISKLQIEFVFVGPNTPMFALPNNFKFIKSNVKPSQCVEIALRAARGNYIAIFADDLVFETPYAIDILITNPELGQNEFNVSSCRYKFSGIVQSDLSLRYFDGDETSPIIPLVGLMHRSALQKIGGIDRRFIAVSYDIDLAMRLQENGGKVYLQNVYVNELEELKGSSRLFNENWRLDRQILDSLWVHNGKVRKNRESELLGFNELNILEVSQGPRGHWRGARNQYLEYLSNFPYRVRRIRMLSRELFHKIKSNFRRN